MEEVWKEVEGYEGIYEVSSKGRFRSLDRYVEYSDGRKPVFKKGRLINGNLTTDGYIGIKLNKNGKTKSMGLHRLVAITFIPCDNKNEMEVNHIDCDRTNNCVENLVPILIRKFLGCLIPSPLIVITFSIKGLFSSTASHTAIAV